MKLTTLSSANLSGSLPTRDEASEAVFSSIRHLIEEGHSQVLNREQALQIAAWALKVSGHSDLKHAVLAELVELPENYG